MKESTLHKIVAVNEALTHERTEMQAVGGNPYDGVPTEELLRLMGVVCPTANALQAECDALSQEIQRREPPE